MTDILFSPTKLGVINLSNRIVMAPMTRSRADENGDMPTELMREYYTQRSSAGLIITEGTHPSVNGKGYCRTPGIYSNEQIVAWQRVTDSVSRQGGAMVLQLMHCGRIASRFNKHERSETVAPSAIQAAGKMYTDAEGMTEFDIPRELATGEIASIVEEYAQATTNAFAAGFAGVELHATSGYLPAQFLSTGANKRSDQYGGSLVNRLRFVVETLEAMVAINGSDRVGMRICPGNPFNDLHDDNPEETFRALLNAVAPLNLAYLHVIRMPTGPVDNIQLAKNHFSGPLIVNDHYSAAEASEVIESGGVSAVSFGRYYISNPDLVNKFMNGEELMGFDMKGLYSPGSQGYTDY